MRKQGSAGLKALDATAGGATMPGSFFDPRIRDLPQRRLFVRSLIPSYRVNTDKVAYVRQTVFTNNAAAVAAGALKPTRRHEAERHFRLLSGAPRRRSRGTHVGVGGFLPPEDAAVEMGVSLEELADMVRGGLLEALEGHGTVYVRPAVVSRLAIRSWRSWRSASVIATAAKDWQNGALRRMTESVPAECP